MSEDDFNLDLDNLIEPPLFDTISLPNINSNHGEAIKQVQDGDNNLDYFDISYQDFEVYKNIERKSDKLKIENKNLLFIKENLERNLQEKEKELEKAYILINFLKDIINTLKHVFG